MLRPPFNHSVCFNLEVKVSWTFSAAEAFTFCSSRRERPSFCISLSLSAGSHFKFGCLVFVLSEPVSLSLCHCLLLPHLSVSLFIFSSVLLFSHFPSLCVNLPVLFLCSESSCMAPFLSVPVYCSISVRTVCRLLAVPQRHGTWLRHLGYK